jgi:O-antigen/teichoic acid export membrane protein
VVNIIPAFFNWTHTERMLTLAFSFYFAFDTIGRYFLSVMRSFEKMEYQAIINFIDRLLMLITALISWYLNFSLLILVLLFALILGLRALICYVIVQNRFCRFSLSWSFDQSLPILKEAYPFALMNLFAIAIARIDVIILKGYHSVESVAIYNTARRIIESFAFIPENIYLAVFPALSMFYLAEKNKFAQIFKKTQIVIIVIAIPITAGLYFLAPRLISLFFEPEFYPAYISLQLLSLAFMALSIRLSLSVALNTTGYQHIFSIIFGFAMIINVILNLLLIPEFQEIGACIALISSETFLVFCSLPFVSRQTDLTWILKFLPRIVFVGGIVWLLFYLIKTWHFALIIVVISLVYPLLLNSFRIILFSELKEYFQLFIKKTSTN